MFFTVNSEIGGSEQDRKNLLGGKGAGLYDMAKMGISVPPFVVLPVTCWADYSKAPKTFMKNLAKQVPAIMDELSSTLGYQPLVSVRSGARVSCPGMMDTVLNVGLDNKTLPAWESKIGSDCAIDSFKRLVTMYGNVVDNVARKDLEKETLPESLAIYERKVGVPFPTAKEQLLNSIEAVFKSWNNERAKTYRKLNSIPDDWGTAVVIQAMVFGNMNDNSGTGVLFTRDPDSGDNQVVGEFLINAQGEDVVAGTATPMKLSKMAEWNEPVSNQLLSTVEKLEILKTDVQDVEFTIQDGTLYILQTRTAKRSARAAVKIASDMVSEGVITLAQSIARVTERELDLANQPVIDPKFTTPAYATGIPACSGVVTGVVCLSSTDAMDIAKLGKKVILVTEETTPDDIGGMNAAVGILTMTGGSTSHAAVVARSMNRPCVVGLGTSYFHVFKAGSTVSIDGATGRVWLGEVPVVGGNNPLVGKFRAAKVGDALMLVNDAPAFKVPRLSLQLGNILHLTNTDIEDIVLKCRKVCDVLTLSYTPGDSEIFMTEADIQSRLQWVAGLLEGLVSYPVETYGFTFGTASHLMVTNLDLTGLVSLKQDVYLGSVAKPWSEAELRVINWLKAEGIAIDLWNTKGTTGPASYSVATA